MHGKTLPVGECGESGKPTGAPRPVPRPLRQARLLAEGQKSADFKHNWAFPPPLPPTQTVGGKGRISREKGPCLPISGPHLAERAKFPEVFGYRVSDACGCARRGAN